MPTEVAVEWLVDAEGCDPEALRSVERVRHVCREVLEQLDLHVIGDGLVHAFPGAGGITALYLLTESHLACHTYPEHGVATFSLCCCRPRPRWDWEGRLTALLGAARVRVRRLPRGVLPSDPEGQP
jgi:S-adenosylmethionine decarboxylase